MPSYERQPSAESLSILELLQKGDIQIIGRMPWSSNFTMLVEVTHGDQTTRAVYKPEEGEQDLWDFPPQIYKREIAAYEFSKILGWPKIPLTLERLDAPMGPGSLQLFIDADFDQHYFTIFEAGEHSDELMRIALFDIVANNTDRKSGHCILGEDNQVYAIDNALCFHAEPKLRTVIWDFQTQSFPDELLEDLQQTIPHLENSLNNLLDESEIEAIKKRIEDASVTQVYPSITSQRQLPWPIV